MNLSEPFIRRPVATTLLTLGLALAGALAFKLLPVAPLPQVDFPTISVAASLPGASPETMAATVATPLERALGRIAGVTEMTSQQLARQLAHHAAVRSRPRHRRRRARRAGGDQCGAQPAADRPAEQPDLPQGQSGRRADHDHRADLGDARPRPDVRRGLDHPRAETVAGEGRRPGHGRRQFAAGGARRTSIPRCSTNTASASTKCAPRSTPTNANRPKGTVEDGDRQWQIYANDQAKQASQYLPLIVAYRNGAAVRLSDVAEVVDSVQDVRNAGISNGKPAVLVLIYRQPGANIIETADRVHEVLPQLQASIPQSIDLKVVMERTTTIRASLARRRAHADDFDRAGDPGGVPVPAQLARDADPERGGAGVADRHLRRDVSVRLQPEQSVADGADHRHRLCRRRRHRRARKRLAPSSKKA